MKADNITSTPEERPAQSNNTATHLSLDDLDQLDVEMAFADYLPMLENLEDSLDAPNLEIPHESPYIISFDDDHDKDLDLGGDLDFSELQSLDNLEEFGYSYGMLYEAAIGNEHYPSQLDVEQIINKIVADTLPKLERELRVQLMRTVRKQMTVMKS